MNSRNSEADMRIWIDHSQGMVRSIATRIHVGLPKSVQYDDLVGYGQLGLVQAAQSYDPSKSVSFQTYAYYRIRGAIYDGLAKMSWTSRALQARIRAERLSAEMLDQQVEEWRASAQQSLAEDADWLVQTTERIAMIHLLSDGSDDSRSLETTAVADEPQPEEELAEEETRAMLRNMIGELKPDEQTIIRQTYFENKSLVETAGLFGKSKSWISRKHAKILEKLARRLATSDGQRLDCP
ncbi:MAG: sigma-70 family RNA polymerase sigma factor [Pirellulaceae bacterium]|nr:sigma-70 family RNA polymerase sigma factor [Pirellulaceae bacterium]